MIYDPIPPHLALLESSFETPSSVVRDVIFGCSPKMGCGVPDAAAAAFVSLIINGAGPLTPLFSADTTKEHSILHYFLGAFAYNVQGGYLENYVFLWTLGCLNLR